MLYLPVLGSRSFKVKIQGAEAGAVRAIQREPKPGFFQGKLEAGKRNLQEPGLFYKVPKLHKDRKILSKQATWNYQLKILIIFILQGVTEKALLDFFANTPFFVSHKHTRKERLVKHKLFVKNECFITPFLLTRTLNDLFDLQDDLDPLEPPPPSSYQQPSI